MHDFQLFLQDFGSLDHLYVVFEAADAIGDHGAFVDRYVETLRQAPEIESVDAQLFEPSKDWGYLSDRVLYLLGPDGATAAMTRFRSPQLEREIAHARDLLSMPSPQVSGASWLQAAALPPRIGNSPKLPIACSNGAMRSVASTR